MASTNKQRENLDRLSTEMNAFMARIDGESRGWTSAECEQYTRMEADYTSLEETINAMERNNKRTADLAQPHNGGSQPAIVDAEVEAAIAESRSPAKIRDRKRLFAQNPHERAFNSYIRQAPRFADISGLNPEDAQALSSATIKNAQSTTGSQGGYLIPQGFSGELDEAMKWFGGIDGVVETFNTETGNPLPYPTVNDTANKGRIIGQNVQAIETDLTFGQLTFNSNIGSSDLVLIPQALIDDSYFDMNGLLARLLGIRLGRLLNWKCTVGSGTGEPYGIVNAAVAQGNTLYAGGSSTSGETASVTYNDLVNLEHSVDPDYRYQPSSRFMFSDAMLKLLKKLVDGNNRPLWQPGLTASFREGAAVDLVAAKPTILDHPYIINQDMATPAASQYSMLFGELQKYKVRKVSGGMTLLRLVERYADYWQIGFIAFMRFDGQLVDAGTHPIAVLQQSAS